ncbi:DsbA family protein [Amycolatopsis sp. cg5]|uniref:DsbA family oxidoreductase n=1 Tax=Amycolatopsis sp. cg5 TaxID=3238802 RepID=UPI003523E243
MPENALRVDIWSDVICPWCFIGKRRLETALGRFEHDVELHWHSFQLDPAHEKGHRVPVREMLAAKFGAPPAQVDGMQRQVTDLAAAEGLTYHLDRAIAVNTLDAHRLGHLAAEHGLGDRMHERLLKAHLSDGEVIDDPDTLVRLGAEVGVPAAEAADVLRGTKYAAEVQADIDQAKRLGITGVPFFVLNGTHGVSGAQSAETFLAALEQAR